VIGLQGETVTRATIVETGISGDRAFQLRDEGGKILGPVPQSRSTTERSILGLGASLDESGGAAVLKVTFQDEVASFELPDFSQKLSHAVMSSP